MQYSFKYLYLTLLITVLPILAKEKSVELLIPEKTDPGWGEIDTSRYLEILKRIDPKNSQSKLEEASNLYRRAVESFRNTEIAIERKREDYNLAQYPEDRYEWQKHARKEAQERELNRMLIEGRNTSIQYLIRGMDILDSIENPRIVQSPAFKDLKAGFYREFIKHQYALKNYTLALDMANRYILLDDSHYKEPEPHKILAVCYEKLEQFASKNKKYEQLEYYKEKKKNHLITYAELRYGKDSDEYLTIMDKILKDY